MENIFPTLFTTQVARGPPSEDSVGFNLDIRTPRQVLRTSSLHAQKEAEKNSTIQSLMCNIHTIRGVAISWETKKTA